MRYKVKNYKSFKNGIGQEYRDDDEQFFYGSDFDIDDKTKLPKISKTMYFQTLTDLDFFVEAYRGMKFITKDNNYYYLLVSDANNLDCKLYRSSGPSGVFSLRFTFDHTAQSVSGLDFISSVYYFNNKLFVIACDSTGGASTLFYSSNGGSSFTKVDLTSIGDFIFDHIITAEGVFVLTEKGIYKSTDGFTFSTYLTFENELSRASRLFFIDGFFYFTAYNSGVFTIYKIGDHLDVDKIFEGNFKSDIFPSSNGFFKIEVEEDNIHIKEYDKVQFNLVKTLKIPEDYKPTGYTESFCWIIGEHRNKVYFEIVLQYNSSGYKNNSLIYSIDRNNSVKLEYKNVVAITADSDWLYFRLYSLDSGFYLLRSGENNEAVIFDDSYQTQFKDLSEIITSIERIDDMLPKKIILYHKPLPATSKVELYQKKDHASSWTKILTSDVENSIKKVYNYPKGSKCDFIQFKIEINSTTDDTQIPEDVYFKFLYSDIGLINAK